jgi:hypothetical protein
MPEEAQRIFVQKLVGQHIVGQQLAMPRMQCIVQLVVED